MNGVGHQSSFRLSKTTFLLGRQCPLRLWRHVRGISESPPEEDTPDAADDFAEQAREVEQIAVMRFAGIVGTSRIPTSVTAALMDDLSTSALFQPSFATDSMLGVADVLERSSHGWILYEVKASSEMKPIFYWDLAFQWLLLEACGHRVAAAKVLHLNRDYVHAGGDVDPQQLLTEVDCTDEVRQILDEARREVERQLEMLSGEAEPAEAPGQRCSGNRNDQEGRRPSDCGHLDTGGLCRQRLPVNWSFDLPSVRGQAMRVYLDRDGNDQIENLDPADAGANWSDVQARVIRAIQAGEPQIDREALRNELDALEWPVACIDFEFEPAVAVPRFTGMRPNQKLPFQWSVQIQDEPTSDLRTVEPFLHVGADDPRPGFIESLLNAVSDSGSIVVHFRQAESSVLGLYEDWFDGRYWNACQQLQGRLFDTCDLARQAYYHPAMNCSFSLKKLAPALLGRGYEGLEIQNGMEAVRQWRRLIATEASEAEKERISKGLLAYCHQDTQLMYDILRRFMQIAG